MRRSILDIFLFLLVIISTAACNNDLPFDLKENPPKLVMNAIINADSTYNTLFSQLSNTCISNSCRHRSHDSNKRVHITYKVDGWLNHK